MNRKGLTSCDETIRGFLGQNPRYDMTANGRLRLRFQAACTPNDEAHYKFPIWRNVVLYDELAQAMSKIKKGSYVQISGWLTKEAKRDENGRIFYKDGEIVNVEILIGRKALELEHTINQSTLPLALSK